MNWNGKTKAVTLSYDDGICSDRRFLEIINRYHLKCTFNLNSALMETPNSWSLDNGFVVHRMDAEEMKGLYTGHEIAVHGSRHLNPAEVLTAEDFDEEYIRDRERLTQFCGEKPIGMAYAYGVHPDSVADRLRQEGFCYARTVWDSYQFDLQTDLMHFRPTCHHEAEPLFELIKRFLEMPDDPDHPQLFYLWGHSYEFDGNNNWDRLERACEMLAGQEDIFYGTNREVLL